MSWFNSNRDSFRFSGSLVAALCVAACGAPETPLKTGIEAHGEVQNARGSVQSKTCTQWPKEIVTHTYSYRRVVRGDTLTTTKQTACMFSPVNIYFQSGNNGELIAMGNDGAYQVLDGDWYPDYDSYQGIQSTVASCGSGCRD